MTTKTQPSDGPTSEERDLRVLRLYEQLIEIEQRLIPTGLHVFGKPSQGAERTDILKMIASFDRPEAGARALPQLVAEGLGLAINERRDGLVTLDEGELKKRERINAIISDALEAFDSNGIDAAIQNLETSSNVNAAQSRPVFTQLEKIAKQLETNGEVDALMSALRGEYVEPGPGADIVQNPAILPT